MELAAEAKKALEIVATSIEEAEVARGQKGNQAHVKNSCGKP